MKKFYVYQLRLENSNLPFYIGKGSGRRKSCHLTESSLRHNNHKNNVIRKALRNGVEIFCDILHCDMSEDDAFLKEIELIATYGRFNFGGILTNASDGGEGSSGYKHTTSALIKMSKTHTGMKKTAETRAKMSASHKKIKKTETHIKNSKFGQWAKNPIWLSAGIIYDTWIDSGKIGSKRLQKIFPEFDIHNMHVRFYKGWIPKQDPDWVLFVKSMTE